MKYKALMLDIDGTLIGAKDSLPSQKVTDAVHKANKKLHVGLATSRPVAAMKRILDQLEIDGPSIIQGGCRIIDSRTAVILWEQTMLPDDLQQAAKILIDLQIPFVINDDGKYYPYGDQYQLFKPLHIWIKEALPLIVGEKILAAVSPIATISATLMPIHGNPDKVEILMTHALATKQHGILEVAKLLKIETDEIIGIGDGYNDFPLLMACGLKIAMGNAGESLKSIADYVAPSVDEDGVADAIEKYILK